MSEESNFTDEPRFRPVDLKLVGYCRRGARVFAAQHGLDYQRFMSEGIEVSVLEGLDDGLAKKAAAFIRQRGS